MANKYLEKIAAVYLKPGGKAKYIKKFVSRARQSATRGEWGAIKDEIDHYTNPIKGIAKNIANRVSAEKGYMRLKGKKV